LERTRHIATLCCQPSKEIIKASFYCGFNLCSGESVLLHTRIYFNPRSWQYYYSYISSKMLIPRRIYSYAHVCVLYFFLKSVHCLGWKKVSPIMEKLSDCSVAKRVHFRFHRLCERDRRIIDGTLKYPYTDWHILTREKNSGLKLPTS